jgi:putative membrane protein
MYSMHDPMLWGMHVLWWLFWVPIVMVLIVLTLTLWRRGARNSPLDILQRRYASGDISTEEYLTRKKQLEDHVPVAAKPAERS